MVGIMSNQIHGWRVALLVVLKIGAHCEGDAVDLSDGHLHQQILVKGIIFTGSRNRSCIGLLLICPPLTLQDRSEYQVKPQQRSHAQKIRPNQRTH